MNKKVFLKGRIDAKSTVTANLTVWRKFEEAVKNNTKIRSLNIIVSQFLAISGLIVSLLGLKIPAIPMAIIGFGWTNIVLFVLKPDRERIVKYKEV